EGHDWHSWDIPPDLGSCQGTIQQVHLDVEHYQPKLFGVLSCQLDAGHAVLDPDDLEAWKGLLAQPLQRAADRGIIIDNQDGWLGRSCHSYSGSNPGRTIRNNRNRSVPLSIACCMIGV